MSIEHAGVHIVRKPWGSRDLSPWAKTSSSEPIGEIWFEPADAARQVDPELLLKLIFTKEILSIQVHPDDDFARLIGLHNGKTEAWYILSAEPGAQVALGLKVRLTRQELRQAIIDGSIAGIVEWRSVVAGDIVFVPAGTIHAIGAGLVVAEIQQRSDTTFRLFDYGRDREIHVDQAVAAADLGPAKVKTTPVNLTDTRIHLVSCPFFTLEHITIPPNSDCELNLKCETWVMVIAGSATFGAVHAGIGVALFSSASRTNIRVGRNGVEALFAYADAEPAQDILCDLRSAKAEPTAPCFENVSKKQPAHLPFRAKEALL